MATPRLVLASRSPRRREILGWLGIDFDVVVPEVEELRSGRDPEGLVLENARLKALAGLEALSGSSTRQAPYGNVMTNPHEDERGGGPVVLGVDTDVVVDGEMLGQPKDRSEAEARLRALSGREHEVLSGVCLLGPRAAGIPGAPPRERTGVSRAIVRFRALDDATIGLYLDSEEWRGRAGGYAIQGLGSMLVEGLEGDFSNVVGLPIGLLLELDPSLGAGVSENTKAKD